MKVEYFSKWHSFMLQQFHSINDLIVFQSTKLYKKRQKKGYNGPNPLFPLIKNERIIE